MSEILSLNGAWRLDTPSVNFKAIKATLPGDNYSALLEAGIIPDPYYSTNETVVQQYREYVWEFSRDVDVPSSLLACQHVYLEMGMVDTYCTVFINGKEAAVSDNMFDMVRVEVKKLLKAGKNTVCLRFKPIPETVDALAASCSQNYPASVFGMKNINMVRRPACYAGWDWGICLVTAGVYDSIQLHGVKSGRIDYLYATQNHKGKTVDVVATAEIYSENTLHDTIVFEFNGTSMRKNITLKPGYNKVSCSFNVLKPKLWWPNGYGEQPLYTLTATLADGETRSARIGLRTVEIVNEQDEFGTSMIFRVNGVDIFCKGADWIPCDALPSRQTEDRYEDILESARLANMNMIRIWGGGQYEKDCMYELCDEKGILIWHDFMFSCSIYPVDDWFVESVKRELAHQLRRLRSHASIALWCGDNECLGAATLWNGEENRLRLTADFMILNRELGKCAAEFDPERVFWPTSPCAGPGDFSDGWHNDSAGDMHYWEVWHGGRDMNNYYSVKPRFCSEFGFQSFPSAELTRTFCPESEWNLFSPIMDHRQKCALGNMPLLNMISKYFRMPSSLDRYLYVSQVTQALAIKTGVEYWRSLKPRCMGTIFWQLNDDWAAISWSAVEYTGKWKQLMAHARRFYAPLISSILPGKEEGGLVLNTTSDLTMQVNASVVVRALDYDGNALGTWSGVADIAPGQSVMHDAFAFEKPDVPYFCQIVTSYRIGKRKYTHENAYFPERFKAMPMRQTSIQATVKKDGDHAFAITLETEKPAFFVNLDTPGIPGRFSDNSFLLLPDEPRTVIFTPKARTTAEKLRKSLMVEHLRETYS